MGTLQDAAATLGVVESVVGRRSDWNDVRSSHRTDGYRHSGYGRRDGAGAGAAGGGVAGGAGIPTGATEAAAG